LFNHKRNTGKLAFAEQVDVIQVLAFYRYPFTTPTPSSLGKHTLSMVVG